METTTHAAPEPKKAALNSLAIVGFVALIIVGILTAIYAASFIPKVLSRFATANVYLSGLGQGTDTVVETPTNTAGTVPSSPVPAVVTPAPVPTAPSTPAPSPTPKPVYTAVPVVHTPTYSGLPDLTVTIVDTGYLRTSNNDSFVRSSSVPSGYQGAVRYTVRNDGTNVSGSYRVEIRVGTNAGTDTDSTTGASLLPNRSVTGTGVFDANSSGTASLKITVDPSDIIDESNERNNTDSSSIRMSGSGSSTTDSYDSNGNYCRYGTYYSNGRYHCDSSNSSSNNDSYDSNGNYCRYGTYYSNNRYYCDTASGSSNNSGSYDSNGNYCQYGTYVSNGRNYCASSSSDQNYTHGPTYCPYGVYYQNNSAYCYSNWP